jgi:hypothetical protein
MYKIALTTALAASLLAAWSNSCTLMRCVIAYSAAIAVYALVRDCWFMWKRGGIVGRLTVNLGIVFWFWLGAIESMLANPPFPTPEKLYLGFASVVPLSVVASGVICVNLFALMSEIGWQQLPQPRRLIQMLSSRQDPPSMTWVDLASLGLAILGWVPILIAYEADLATALSDMLRMRSGGRIGASRQPGLANHLQLLGLFGGALAIARIVTRPSGFVVARYLAAATCLPLVFLGASRFNLAFLFLPSLLILVAPVRHFFRWERRRRIALALTVLTGTLVLFQGAVRTSGLGQNSKRRSVSLTKTLQSGWFGHDHFGAMLIAIDLVDSRGGFFLEPIAPFFVTHFIPRRFWSEKPYPVSWMTYNEVVTRGHNFNVTPSVTGQYYMNWSYPGVAFIGLFIGWLARCCETWFSELELRRQLMSATVAGLFLAFIFLSFRFFYPLYFSYPLFGFIAYVMLTRKTKRAAVLPCVSY